jgi:hypothetical protein
MHAEVGSDGERSVAVTMTPSSWWWWEQLLLGGPRNLVVFGRLPCLASLDFACFGWCSLHPLNVPLSAPLLALLFLCYVLLCLSLLSRITEMTIPTHISMI